jgi:ribose 5-phosphate isomerase B
MVKIRIGIAADHAGFKLKEEIRKYLAAMNMEVKDFGTNSEDSVDYPDFVHPLGEALEQSTIDMGIVMCGSGNGVNITANKHQGVRSALCWSPEVATLARKHNNANVLAMPARFLDVETAKEIVKSFVGENFEGGRHLNRINKIEQDEN